MPVVAERAPIRSKKLLRVFTRSRRHSRIEAEVVHLDGSMMKLASGAMCKRTNIPTTFLSR
jgi:hypothetical protein